MSANIIVERDILDNLLNNRKVEGYKLVENNIVCEDMDDGVFAFKAIIMYNDRVYTVSGHYEYEIEFDNYDEDEESVKCIRVDEKHEQYYIELIKLKNKYNI